MANHDFTNFEKTTDEVGSLPRSLDCSLFPLNEGVKERRKGEKGKEKGGARRYTFRQCTLKQLIFITLFEKLTGITVSRLRSQRY
jgi:hypothetical protein